VTDVGLHCSNNAISGRAGVIHYGTVPLLLYCPHRELPILLNKLSIKYLFLGAVDIILMRLDEN
jgi:hypothetical protein